MEVDLEYSQENITKIRIKLNSGKYSQSWLIKHIRGMAEELIKKNQELQFFKARCIMKEDKNESR